MLPTLPGWHVGPKAYAYPRPIAQEEDGTWYIVTDAIFPASGITLELRKLAYLPDPDPVGHAFKRARPNKLTFAPGDDRLFVPDAGLTSTDDPPTGVVYAVAADGSSVESMLHVGQAVFDLFGMDGAVAHVLVAQGGLRSLAFHPGFDDPRSPGFGKVYTTQTQFRPTDDRGLVFVGPSDPPGDNTDNIDGVLSEWDAVFDGDGRFESIDPTSYREILRITTPDAQHPVKEIAFNPYSVAGDEDFGLLYLLQGDGTESQTDGTGQNGLNALGKVLRIDPFPSESLPYRVPESNPFVDDPGVLDEIYSLGHRNVHTISFARDDECGPLIIVSEIGHGSVEELNIILPGEDYGWGLREGTFERVDFLNVNDLPADDAVNGFRYPIAQYGHHPRDSSHAIAGGYLVDNHSAINGHYFFGDFTSGHRPLFCITREGALNAVATGEPGDLAPAAITSVAVALDHDGDPSTPAIAKASYLDVLDDEPTFVGSRTDLRFGRGPKGEIYLLNKRNGWIYLVVNSLPDARIAFDENGDGVVNSGDTHAFSLCVSGPGGEAQAACLRCTENRFDLDGDGDFDLREIQSLFNAWGVTP